VITLLGGENGFNVGEELFGRSALNGMVLCFDLPIIVVIDGWSV